LDLILPGLAGSDGASASAPAPASPPVRRARPKAQDE
jgi:hypothetical protein